MTLFNYCLWHNWKFRTVYYDCSNICFWSSGFEKYRRCKDCGLQESKILAMIIATGNQIKIKIYLRNKNAKVNV